MTQNPPSVQLDAPVPNDEKSLGPLQKIVRDRHGVWVSNIPPEPKHVAKAMEDIIPKRQRQAEAAYYPLVEYKGGRPEALTAEQARAHKHFIFPGIDAGGDAYFATNNLELLKVKQFTSPETPWVCVDNLVPLNLKQSPVVDGITVDRRSMVGPDTVSDPAFIAPEVKKFVDDVLMPQVRAEGENFTGAVLCGFSFGVIVVENVMRQFRAQLAEEGLDVEAYAGKMRTLGLGMNYVDPQETRTHYGLNLTSAADQMPPRTSYMVHHMMEVAAGKTTPLCAHAPGNDNQLVAVLSPEQTLDAFGVQKNGETLRRANVAGHGLGAYVDAITMHTPKLYAYACALMDLDHSPQAARDAIGTLPMEKFRHVKLDALRNAKPLASDPSGARYCTQRVQSNQMHKEEKVWQEEFGAFEHPLVGKQPAGFVK